MFQLPETNDSGSSIQTKHDLLSWIKRGFQTYFIKSYSEAIAVSKGEGWVICFPKAPFYQIFDHPCLFLLLWQGFAQDSARSEVKRKKEKSVKLSCKQKNYSNGQYPEVSLNWKVKSCEYCTLWTNIWVWDKPCEVMPQFKNHHVFRAVGRRKNLHLSEQNGKAVPGNK